MDEQQAKLERLKKFQGLGIPVPMAPINPGTAINLNANPDKLRKLEEIKKGLKKDLIQTFIQKESPNQTFSSMPTPKQRKNPNAPAATNVPELAEFKVSRNSEADLLEQALYGGSVTPQTKKEILNDSEPAQDNGAAFINDFKNKLTERLNKKSSTEGSFIQESRKTGLQLTDDELNERIADISTHVAKETVKKVLMEYAKQNGGLITENDKVKRAEIIGKDIVRIEGKTYRLTPVIIKKKE